jgi:hypothetical protein
MTWAPAALAIWMAVTPMPLVAPWTSRVSPAFSPPASKTLAKTVQTVSGRAAAWTKSTPGGMGRAWRASTTASPA